MHTVQQLEAALPSIPAGQKEFARSLIDQSQRRGLSEKQLFWVNKLVEAARQPAKPAPVAKKVGDLGGILALFATAKQHLKFPAITLNVPAAHGMLVRINVAGERAKFPGSLNVTSGEKPGDERRSWYGRVKTDGSYEPSREAGDVANRIEAITARLAEFAADPARIAAEYGKLNGICCFCSQRLGARHGSKKPSPTALKSLAVGYGKDCAEHYGLPWGER